MKTIIFDFDGTIADTLESGVSAYNKIAAERGYKQVTLENREYLRGLSPQKVMSELGVSLFDLPRVVLSLQKALHSQVAGLKPYLGISEVLVALKNKGLHLVMLSSNSAENVKQFLSDHKIDVFDQVHTGSSIFGKARLLTQILKTNGISATDAVYVGDEIRDIEGAKKAGIKIISVAWGLNNREALTKYQPDFLANKPGDLLSILA